MLEALVTTINCSLGQLFETMKNNVRIFLDLPGLKETTKSHKGLMRAYTTAQKRLIVVNISQC